MRKKYNLSAILILQLIIIIVIHSCGDNNQPKQEESKPNSLNAVPNNAFLNHRDSVPSQQQYPHALFTLSHDYPATVKPVVNPSWRQALHGQPISAKNTFAYVDALKSYIAPRVLPFFTNNTGWTAAKYGWFQEPWLGTEREAIQGIYYGSNNPANMFKSLKEDETGYALVLYDSTAAYTVGQIWGKTGEKINVLNNAAQFKEGSLIVKLAFSNINYPEWPVMQGAPTFSIYDSIITKGSPTPGYQVRKVSCFQIDIIVKDSLTAPQTGWVYSTLVYDKDAKGSVWEKMVPLGAMWGNDPGVKSPIAPPYPKLYESVINPKAPAYSKETLGWGGRLSGPNDGAVAQDAVDINDTTKKYKNLALSSCMSCHLPAQYKFKSFLLPAPFPNSNTLYVYTPGSSLWNLWFRNNYGNVPFDSTQVAMDYDMVMAFKSMRAYNKAHPSVQNKLLKDQLDVIAQFRRHNTKSR